MEWGMYEDGVRNVWGWNEECMRMEWGRYEDGMRKIWGWNEEDANLFWYRSTCTGFMEERFHDMHTIPLGTSTFDQKRHVKVDDFVVQPCRWPQTLYRLIRQFGGEFFNCNRTVRMPATYGHLIQVILILFNFSFYLGPSFDTEELLQRWFHWSHVLNGYVLVCRYFVSFINYFRKWCLQSEHSCKVNIPLYCHIHTQPFIQTCVDTVGEFI